MSRVTGAAAWRSRAAGAGRRRAGQAVQHRGGADGLAAGRRWLKSMGGGSAGGLPGKLPQADGLEAEDLGDRGQPERDGHQVEDHPDPADGFQLDG